MTDLQSNTNPFVRKTHAANAIVLFWVERIAHVNIGKRAAKHFLNTRMGANEGADALKRGYILCDTYEDALVVAQELRAVTDMSVGQFVFGAKVYVSPNFTVRTH
jgi:hypothetical protein